MRFNKCYKILNTSSSAQHRIMACRYCDHICQVPTLDRYDVAYCPNCEHRLTKAGQDNAQILLAFSISAFIFLILSLCFPFISFTSQGLSKTIYLLDAVLVMFNYNYPLLALFINMSILILPATLLLLIMLLYSPWQQHLNTKVAAATIKGISWLHSWCMVEIFFISIIVSMVKLVSMAQIGFGPSFWAFAGFSLFLLLTLWQIDLARLWHRVLPQAHDDVHDDAIETNRKAIEQSLSVCSHCGKIEKRGHCQRCYSKIKMRDPHSLQKTLAWSITALLFYIPANIYPIMTTVVLGKHEPANIITGIVLLWKDQAYSVAIIIFLASIVVPLMKLLVMLSLCLVTSLNSAFSKIAFTRIFSITELIGRWSMIDVFVVTILVALIQLGGILKVYPGVGAFFFAAMVVSSMMATHSFDPRLLWDNQSDLKTLNKMRLMIRPEKIK